MKAPPTTSPGGSGGTARVLTRQFLLDYVEKVEFANDQFAVRGSIPVNGRRQPCWMSQPELFPLLQIEGYIDNN
jgi:hypothetical protein